MSLRSSIEFYKQAKYLYKNIAEVFDDFEEGKVSDVQQDTIIERTLNDINRLNNTLPKVSMRDLEEEYDKETIEDVEHNVDFFYEAADHIEKYLLGKKYYSSLLNGIHALFRKLSLSQRDYEKYAKDENELAKKFTATLLNPSNIMQFMNQIKRMAVGTMSIHEFKKIYQTNKNKMIKLPKYNFQSFNKYKNSEEEDEDSSHKSTARRLQYKP
jgi:hypothetical protein